MFTFKVGDEVSVVTNPNEWAIIGERGGFIGPYRVIATEKSHCLKCAGHSQQLTLRAIGHNRNVENASGFWFDASCGRGKVKATCVCPPLLLPFNYSPIDEFFDYSPIDNVFDNFV